MARNNGTFLFFFWDVSLFDLDAFCIVICVDDALLLLFCRCFTLGLSNRCGSQFGSSARNLDILSSFNNDDNANIDAFDSATIPSGALNAYCASNCGDVKSKILECILLSSVVSIL